LPAMMFINFAFYIPLTGERLVQAYMYLPLRHPSTFSHIVFQYRYTGSSFYSTQFVTSC